MNVCFPNIAHERRLTKEGYRMIVGVDEVGVGCLAGPLVAAAVMLPQDIVLDDLDDSKVKTEGQRNHLYDSILKTAPAWSVGEASVEEINTLGIRPANYLAMRRAIEEIPGADFALIDAWTIPGLSIPQRGIIRGDHLVASIAAASIVAKVTRDRMMAELAQMFPEYGFEKHKGYSTSFHCKQLQTYGPSPLHRTSWKFFKEKAYFKVGQH